jgi:hypothetical protein
MNDSILYNVPAPLIGIFFFVLILFINWVGFRYRKIGLKKKPDEDIEGIGTIEGAMLGLMALFIAFSFSMAASKFDDRRHLIVQEANDIGTALLRCDLYPDSIRNLLRADFAKYVDARIAYYDAIEDQEKIKTALQDAATYSGKIWNRVAALSRNLDNRVQSAQMIPALNDMIDIVTTRESSRISKVPPIILFILFLLTLASSFLIGFSYKAQKRNFVPIMGFALMTSMALYLILELDRPRRGIINVDAAEKNIVELRKSF